MKTIILLLATAGLFITTGCVGPLYTNENQASAGKGWGLFGSYGAYQAKTHRLAVDKMSNTPVNSLVTNGVFHGYFGIIANPSTRRLTFKYEGPEHGVETLGAGQQVEKYLLPGVYSGKIFFGGNLVGWIEFTSEPVDKGYLGRRVHWSFYAEY